MINNIFNESCLDTMARMPDNYLDLTITSPPYDEARSYHDNVDKTWGPLMWTSVINQLYSKTKPGGLVVWVVGDMTKKGGETLSSFRQAIAAQAAGFLQHDTMIWNKGSFVFPSITRYHQVFEYMFVWSKGKPKTFNSLKDRPNKYKKSGGASGRTKSGNLSPHAKAGIVYAELGQRFNIWDYPVGGGHCTKDKVAYGHPAIFPEQLAADLIKSWSNPNDLVFDPFTGSGTTAKMSVVLGRNFIGSEISKEYCEIAEQRIEIGKKLAERIKDE